MKENMSITGYVAKERQCWWLLLTVVTQQSFCEASPLRVEETGMPAGMALALASSLLEQGVLWGNWAVP